MTTTAGFLDIALPLLDRGFSLIPLKARDKAPQPGIGVRSRSREKAQIEKWALEFPDANVGVVADSHFLILDADNDEQLRTLLKNAKGVSIPPTYTVESSPGRRHYYFKHSARTRTSKNLVIGGLFEVRLKEQYVVGAGSIHKKTGEPYRAVNNADPVEMPNELLSALGYLKGEARVRTDRAKVIVQAGQKLGEGEGRHYAILDFCAKNFTGGKTIEELYAEAMEFNETHCDPPHSPEHVASIVNWFEGREYYSKGIEVRIGPDVPIDRAPHHYIISRKNNDRHFGHWFPRDTVSLVAGASGAGKTIMMTGILETLRLGISVFKHPETTAEYGLVLIDRSIEELRESLEDKGADIDAVVKRAVEVDILQEVPPPEVVDTSLKAWRDDGRRVDVVFVEGADMWCPDPNDMKATLRFLKSLIGVAKEWNAAIIASVGSPKQKPKEQYLLTRDKVFGSIAWGRTCSTIVHIGLTDPADPDSVRQVMVLPRTGRCERFWFSFVDGAPVYTDEDPTKKPESEPLAGVAETRELLRRDLGAELIEYIEGLPVGTQLNAGKMRWLAGREKVTELFQQLSDPRIGGGPWLEKQGNRYHVAQRRRAAAVAAAD
jgi:hypothetical protein